VTVVSEGQMGDPFVCLYPCAWGNWRKEDPIKSTL